MRKADDHYLAWFFKLWKNVWNYGSIGKFFDEKFKFQEKWSFFCEIYTKERLDLKQKGKKNHLIFIKKQIKKILFANVFKTSWKVLSKKPEFVQN